MSDYEQIAKERDTYREMVEERERDRVRLIHELAASEERASRLETALRELRECVVKRSTVEGDLPWTSDVTKALQLANAALAMKTREALP